MLNLLHGELYRLLHKRSMYIYFALLAVGYALIVFVRSGGFMPESLVDDAISAFAFLPVVVGGFFFAALYTDDLSAKNLISLVGFGINKTKIVIAKFILVALLNGIVFVIAPVFHGALYALFGQGVSGEALSLLYADVLKLFLMTAAFSALAGILVYGLQRPTIALVAYVLLAFNVVSGLIATLLNMVDPLLKSHLIPGITDNILMGLISGNSFVYPAAEYFVYVALVLVASAFVFTKKEMEF